jgi:hypothetical protein
MPGNATSGNLVMSPEQFERLLASLKTGPSPTPSGNLADCKSRFAGAKGESVAAFIDAVTIHKDCVGVSDLNALKGLAMLLDGAAATWWQGTRATVDNWETAIDALRRSFRELKPNYKIFRELFSRQQKDTEAADAFINSARALLAKLSPLHEVHQMNMIYGLLSSKIRRLVPRDELNNFETFIAKTRGAEDALKEEEVLEIEKGTKTRPKCSYCGTHGHMEKGCRKLARSQEATSARQETTTRTTLEQTICFGCRQSGHVRSQCPKERPQRNSTTAEILTAGLGDVCRAFMPVTIAGKEGLAYVDSGASRSIAGHNLYGHLKRIKAPFTRLTQELTMADGEPVEIATEVYKVQVQVNGRIVHTSVTAIPEHSRGKTLLGMDFIKAADVILDFPRMQWRFRNKPNWTPLVSEKEVFLTASTVQLEPLRDDEGTELDEIQKEQLVRLLDSHKEVFEKSDEPTPYAEHRITLTDESTIVTTPYRMSPQRRTLLEKEIQTVVEESVIEPYISKTDASSYALRACLLQGEDQGEKPLEYASRLLTPAEKNHTKTERETLMVVSEITQHLRKIADTLSNVRETYEQDKVKKYADLRRRISSPFEVGDRVLVDVHALSKASHSYTSKFAPRRDGPYVVIEKKGPVAYVVAAVDDPDHPLGKYHVSALRPFVSSVCETHTEPVAPLRRRGRLRKAQPDDRPEDEATTNQPRSPPRQIRGVRRGRRGAARPREDQIQTKRAQLDPT